MFAHKALPHYEQTGRPKNFATEPHPLLSISMRPSVRNRINPSQYLAMYLSAAPVGDLAETCARAWPNHALKVSILGAFFGLAQRQSILGRCAAVWHCQSKIG